MSFNKGQARDQKAKGRKGGIADYTSFQNDDFPEKPAAIAEDLPDTPNTTMSMFIKGHGGDGAVVEESKPPLDLPSKPPSPNPQSKKQKRALAKKSRPPPLNLKKSVADAQPAVTPGNPFLPFDFGKRGDENPSLASTNAAEYEASPVWYPHAIAPQLPIRQKHKPLAPQPIAPGKTGKGTLVQRSEVPSMAGVLSLATPIDPLPAAPQPSSRATLPLPDPLSVLRLYNTSATAAAKTRSDGDKSGQDESGEDACDGDEAERNPSAAYLLRKSGFRRCFSSESLKQTSTANRLVSLPTTPPSPASQYVTQAHMEERMAQVEKRHTDAVEVFAEEVAALRQQVVVLLGLLGGGVLRPVDHWC